MHWLNLPPAGEGTAPALTDLNAAKSWLKAQPLSQPVQMLVALQRQIEAQRASAELPADAFQILDLMHFSAFASVDALAARYLRKPLPMSTGDQQAFDAASAFWRSLGVAYLQLAQQLSAEQQSIPLQRAACAFREVGICHYQAAAEYPKDVDRLLFGVLAQAKLSGVLTQAMADPGFPHYGEANVAGHIAWALLLRFVDPYRLSAAQLLVANRGFSRWRELAVFQAVPSDDPKAHSVDLTPLFGGDALPAEVPRWLEIRKVERKILQRIKALQEGQSPEALKLGRELSIAACIRLLRQLDEALEDQYRPPSDEAGSIELAFGSENAFAIFRDEALNPVNKLNVRSSAIAHQRMAVFGFDRVSQMPASIKRLNVPSEAWMLMRGKAVRPQGESGERRLSPCLIATKRGGQPKLGVMLGLRTVSDGALMAELTWFEEQVEAGMLAPRTGEAPDAARIAVFLLKDGPAYSLLVPASTPLRLDFPVALSGLKIAQVLPVEVIERGVDFTRYAVRTQ